MPDFNDSTAIPDYTTVTSVTFEPMRTSNVHLHRQRHDTDDDDDESVTFGFSSSLPTGIR